MLKLEDQVTNYELSKKLKELGYPQRGLFEWRVYEDEEEEALVVESCGLVDYQWPHNILCIAPTASELLAVLPSGVEDEDFNGNKHDYSLTIEKDIVFCCSFYCFDKRRLHASLPYFDDKILANACAEMLIYLIENELMEMPE